jgi:hypothetical protein
MISFLKSRLFSKLIQFLFFESANGEDSFHKLNPFGQWHGATKVHVQNETKPQKIRLYNCITFFFNTTNSTNLGEKNPLQKNAPSTT